MTSLSAPRSTGIVALAVVVLGSASGCLRGGRPVESEPPVSAAPRASTGGTLRLFHEAPASLDPVDVGSVYESLPVNQLFDGLVYLDAGLSIRPALAETWEISRDGCGYVFHLRDGVKFHDGSTLSAEDVEYSIRRALDPRRAGDSLVAPYLGVVRGADEFRAGRAPRIEGLRMIDRLTVAIDLDHAYPSFLEVLAMDSLKVVSKSAVERAGAAGIARSPIGTGPFALESWDPDRLVLAAFEGWHGGRSKVDRVEVVFADAFEPELGERLFRAGELDAFEPDSEAVAGLSGFDNVRVARWPELSLSFLGLDTRTPPLDRVEVRLAIAHALDRRALVDLLPSLRRHAVGILPPGMAAYSPDVKVLPHDPDLARRLLHQAGYSAASPLPPIDMYTASRSPTAVRTAERIAADLHAVGIAVRVRHVSWPELTARVDAGTAPAFLLSWLADMNDPDAFLRALFDIDGPDNYFGFRDADSQAMLDAGAYELAPDRRARIYRRLERRILERAPLVPLYHTLGTLAVRDRVVGIDPGPMGLANVELERVSLTG